MIKLSPLRTNSPVSSNVVSEVEKRLGVVFSKSYKDFLLTYNGGLFEEQLLSLDSDETNIVFLGVGGEKDLVHINRLYDGRLPASVVAIGMDPGGDLVCLSLREDESYDSVYYWRAEAELAPPAIGSLIKISDSFIGFLAALEKDAY